MWFALLQPWHVLPVAALELPALVDASLRDFAVFVLLLVDEVPLSMCPLMRLLSAISASHWCMMRRGSYNTRYSLGSWH